MNRLLVAGLIAFGALAVLVLVLALAVGLLSGAGRERIARETILEIDFEQGVVEYVSDDPFERLTRGDVPTVRDTVEALARASSDRRVKALIARVGAVPMSLATIQELRDALAAFRESGKRAVAYAETFGEFGPGNGAYYLATAFDEIFLQPSGDVGLTGLMYETPFLRGTLDKLGVVARLDHRHEYKNAMNTLTERRFTGPHREALDELMRSQFGQIVRGIAAARGLDEQRVRELADAGPYLGQEAVEAGLVDDLAYRDEVYERVKQEAGRSARLLYLSRYLERAGRPHARGKTIALIYGVGGVVRGEGGYDPLSGEYLMGADRVASAFRAAVADRRVRAILFRVNSPGGSYVASDTIWRETVRAREAGKPVIVSMGGVAGSGGYFVAMSADRIVAQPATITGSIGVYGGKLLTRGLWSKIGLGFDEVHTSRHATIWSNHHDYGAGEYERFQASLDRIYEDFTAKVAAGRGLEPERVHEIARGRIWSGEDALRLGLVDALGGFDVALRLAREAAGLEPDEPVRLRVYPRPRSTLEALFGEKRENSEPRGAAAAIGRVLARVQPWVREARRLGLGPAGGVLSMPVPEAAD